MNEANFEDIELGNLLFGNSRGKYLIEPREKYQRTFLRFLYRNEFDRYGYTKDGKNEFENDTFVIRTYYWGFDEDIANLPNFVYKPAKLEIKWYKYPMRDAYSNQLISIEEFETILRKCEESLK